MISPYVSIQGKNHSKKLKNFFAGSQQPPAIRIPEIPEAGGQTALSSGSSDSDAGRQVRRALGTHYLNVTRLYEEVEAAAEVANLLIEIVSP